MNAYKYFTTLDLNEKMPKFPVTFNEAFYLSVTPLWYYIMNPFVDEQLEGKKVPESHIRFVKFLRHVVFTGVVGLCVYAYHATVQPIQLSL
jgi:hypothetical protein